MPIDVVKQANDLTTLLPIIHRLRSSFAEQGDEERVERSDLMAQKWMNRQVVLAFAGHFSAGKSTLINAILGVSLLPSSPLPTSANVVRMEYGYPHAEVIFANGNGIEVVDLANEIDDLCRDGDHIDEVRVFSDIAYLQGGFVLIDTPGVDSTDTRHAEHTHKIIYLADLIVYVADYNHVLSDMNLSFMRKQTDLGKQLVLVVNQIDKHNEFELSFDEFTAGIEQALRVWKITYSDVFYVSALDLSFPENQFERLRAELPNLACTAQTVGRGTTDLFTLIAEHDAWLTQELYDQQEELTMAEAEQILAIDHELRSQIEQEQTERRFKVSEFITKLTAIVMQAIIMPYETTEHAVAYIDSLSDHFRIGFFATAAKVAAERQRRLDVLVADISTRVQTGIEIHIKQVAMQVVRDEGVLSEFAGDGFSFIEGFSGEQFVASCVAQGAQMDRDYGYQFAQKVEQALRDLYVARVREISHRLESELGEKARPQQMEWEQQLGQLGEKQQLATDMIAQSVQQAQWIESLRALVDPGAAQGGSYQ